MDTSRNSEYMEFKDEGKFVTDVFLETKLAFIKHAVEISETEMAAHRLVPTWSFCVIGLVDKIIQLLRI